jgi:hypothetical protein
MFGRSNLLTVIALVYVLTAGLPWTAAGSAPRESAAAAVNPPVRFHWFPNAPAGISVPEFASKVDDLILTGDTGSTYLKQLRAAGYQGKVLNYVYALGVSNHPNAWWNQLCRGGEFPSLPESFFLHDGNGNRLSRDNIQGDGSRTVAINPGDPGFRRWAIDRMRWMLQAWGYDGIFLDEVWGYSHLVQHWRNQTGSLREFADADAFRQAWRSFLTQIRQELGVPVYANIETLEDYDQFLDGWMMEHWASGWVGGAPMTPTRIEQIWNRLDSTGKGALLITQGDRTNVEMMRFGLATYLMVARPGISFRFTTYVNNGYGQFWWYPEYEVKLGRPLRPRERLSGSLWQRRFAGGWVRVDLATRKVQIKLSAEPSGRATPRPPITTARLQPTKAPQASPPPRSGKPKSRRGTSTAARAERRTTALRDAGVSWDGQAFGSASELRAYIESQGVSWSVFLRRNPAAAARLGLKVARWRGPDLVQSKVESSRIS